MFLCQFFHFKNSILIRWESNLDKNMGNDKKIFECFCPKLTPTVQQVYTWSTKKIIPNGHFFVIRYMLSIVWFIIQNKWLKILRFQTRWKVWYKGVKLKTYVSESFTTSLKHSRNNIEINVDKFNFVCLSEFSFNS